MLNKVVIFVFFAHKKYSHSFVKITLEPLIVLPMSLLRFWVWEHFSCIAVYGGTESSRISSKNILIRVSKNEGLTGLERHEGE